MLNFGKFKNKIIKFEKFSSTEKEKSRCFLRALQGKLVTMATSTCLKEVLSVNQGFYFRKANNDIFRDVFFFFSKDNFVNVFNDFAF